MLLQVSRLIVLCDSCIISLLIFFRPLIQNKLEVLGKAGLSEDELEADCTFFKVMITFLKQVLFIIIIAIIIIIIIIIIITIITIRIMTIRIRITTLLSSFKFVFISYTNT